jgi:hypothetical protein
MSNGFSCLQCLHVVSIVFMCLSAMDHSYSLSANNTATFAGMLDYALHCSVYGLNRWIHVDHNEIQERVSATDSARSDRKTTAPIVFNCSEKSVSGEISCKSMLLFMQRCNNCSAFALGCSVYRKHCLCPDWQYRQCLGEVQTVTRQ